MVKENPRLKPIDQAILDMIARKHVAFLAARIGGARAVLAGYDLSHLNLSGYDFSHADFTGAVLRHSVLRETKLDYSVMFGADMRFCNMHNTSAIRADFRGARLRGSLMLHANLSGADLRKGAIAGQKGMAHISSEWAGQDAITDLTGTNLSYAILSGAAASYADFSDATLKCTKAIRANFSGARFTRANLEDADLSLCDLRKANLVKAMMARTVTGMVDFAETDLQGVLTDKIGSPSLRDLSSPLPEMLQNHREWIGSHGRYGKKLSINGFDLRSTVGFATACLTLMDAKKAVLCGIDFSETQFQGADLRDSDMRYCKFVSADMRGSILAGAMMNNTMMQGVNLEPLQFEDGRQVAADLRNASFRFANMSAANLRQADLRGADLTGANLVGCNLSGANLEGAVLEGARFTAANGKSTPAARDMPEMRKEDAYEIMWAETYEKMPDAGSGIWPELQPEVVQAQERQTFAG